jgi:hypothetical protein
MSKLELTRKLDEPRVIEQPTIEGLLDTIGCLLSEQCNLLSITEDYMSKINFYGREKSISITPEEEAPLNFDSVAYKLETIESRINYLNQIIESINNQLSSNL